MVLWLFFCGTADPNTINDPSTDGRVTVNNCDISTTFNRGGLGEYKKTAMGAASGTWQQLTVP